MTTVVRRTFKSVPARDANQTWALIVEMLTRANNVEAEAELMSISGIAASLITEKGPEDSPIIVTCDGPRTRIYCLYDEDAIDGDGLSEEPLGYDPLKGDWKVSLPCPKDDLDWVNGALNKKSSRITARDLDEKKTEKSSNDARKTEAALEINLDEFLKS